MDAAIAGKKVPGYYAILIINWLVETKGLTINQAGE